ncbi:hypothetical protein VTJ04DRAFT_6274 [Mycothermus thermophilus]|uniref:uncharacterized protein n=1 Tax=Humicola insolens TaxID=85995 RepID=UPI003742DD25
MADLDEDEVRERLKSALWYSIGKIVDQESIQRSRNATPQFIAALTDLVWHQIETIATDLESFSQHAGRTTITTDDVLLLARRNQDLYALIKDGIDKERAKRVKGKGRGRT